MVISTRKGMGFLIVAMLAVWLMAESGDAARLGSMTIRVLGIQVDVDTRPDIEGLQTTMTAVKDFPTAVQTVVGVPGMQTTPALPEGTMVKAELSGPGFGDQVITLASLPNQPLEIPTLAAAGDYYLANVRLEDAHGNLMMMREPTRAPVVINTIEKLLVTQVNSRALTLEEIKEKGIVIDEDNFTALNFTVGLTLGSDQVEIDLPVVIPTTIEAAATVEPPQLTRLPSVQRAFDSINIPNFSLSGFQLRVPPEFKEGTGIELPPINGVIVIPGNIGFLNQFFSVILQATNVAPEGSGLVLNNTLATINLPLGGDGIKGTGDDPLRVAETEKEGVQEALPLLDQQGSNTIVPRATNQAEFLVEGLREGTNKLGFDIVGDLYVPALAKTVTMTGKAAGVVQVKNPTFSIVLSHPDVVRDGEEYSIFATVTNTSSMAANLFQIALNTRSMSGARLAEGEEDLKELEALEPGQAESFEFRLVARTTGEVTGTVFLADEGVNGSFVLTTGVGDTGIPLSPDTLVLPDTVDYLPEEPDILFQAVRLLGQAYSVATAPAGSLPPAISRVRKGFVFQRAVKLAQAGLHVRFGEPIAAAAEDIILDYFGSDMGRLEELFGDDPKEMAGLERDWRAFDVLRRAADAGNDFADAMGTLLGLNPPGSRSIAALQLEWAETFASRPFHLSCGASTPGTPVYLRLTDPDGRALGRLDANTKLVRDLPFADRLPLSQQEDRNAKILFAAVPEASSYTIEWATEGATTLELSLVLPETDAMVHVVYPAITLTAGGYGRLVWTAKEENAYRFEADTDGDGSFDQVLEPSEILTLRDRPPVVRGVYQWAKGAQPDRNPSFQFGDPLGRMLGVLFSEEVTFDSAEDVLNYEIPANEITEVSLQPDRRLAFMVLEKPVGPFLERSLTLSGVADLKGNGIERAVVSVTPDLDRGTGGTFNGQVVTADGRPVPFATVKYIQPLQYPVLGGGCNGSTDVQDFVITSYDTGPEGRFAIDFVLQADFPPECPSNPDIWLNENHPASTDHFKLETTDPETGEMGKASTRIHYDGQNMRLKVIIRGYGSLNGTVYDDAGNLVTGGDPGSSDILWIIARNISTGEVYRSWIDGEGRYAFPRAYETAEGEVIEASKVVVGNLILHAVRPKDGYTAVTTVNLPSGGTTLTQDLVMISPNRYGSVSGLVLETGGHKGAENVKVQIAGRVLSSVDLYSRSYSRGVVGSTFTDKEGAFRFDQVPIGDIEVRAVRQATYEQADAKSVLAEGENKTVNMVFPGTGGTVRGVVRDAFGQLVPGATLAGGPTLTETDENGFFEVTGLPLGKYTFYAQSKTSPALGRVEVETLGPDDIQEVLITLEPTGTVGGMVHLSDGVTTVGGQKVQLWLEPNKGILADTLTDPEGKFLFEDYPLGEYSVRAVAADHGDGGMAYTSIRFAGDMRDADITFRGLGEIKGRVVQSNGTPSVSDVIVTRKVWRIFTQSDAAGGPKIFMEVIRKVQEQVDEAQAELIEKALQEAGLSDPSAEFFMLVDESKLVSSDTLGPNGEVTGRFRVTGAVAGPFRVAAFGPFLAPAEVTREIPKTTDPLQRSIDVGDVVLEPATASVGGTVYLPDGATPVGADVSVKIRSLDNSGSVMTAGGGVSQPVLPEYAVVTDNNGHFHFPLVLRGRFILTADTGVPKGEIRAHAIDQVETERFADAEGNRLLNVRLYGRGNGVVPAGETLTVDIRLHDVAGVQVNVVQSDGKTPVPFARVSLKTASTLDTDEELAAQRLNADENGAIELFPVVEGKFSVSARDPDSPGRGQAEGVVAVNPDPQLRIPVTITLGAVTTVAGQVVPASFFGTVEGTVYKADGKAQMNPVQLTVKSQGISILTTSDDAGRYRAEDIPGGLLSIEAFEPYTARRGNATGTLAKDGQVLEVPVTLVGLGTVTGTVLSNDGSRRLSALDVILYPTGRFTDRLISRSDAQGIYSLPGVPLGPYTVKVKDTHSVLTGESSGEMRNDGDRNTTDVRLEASGRITGKVYAAGVILNDAGEPVDAEGRAIADPPVVANASVAIRGSRTGQTVQADDRGEFKSGGFLPLGEYNLTVRPVKGDDGVTRQTALKFEGEQAFVPMALAGTGTVSGVVLDSLGEKPVGVARVTLRSRSPFSRKEVSRFTEADGTFLFENVPVGDFSLSVITTVGEPELRAAAEGVLTRHAETLIFRDTDDDAKPQAIRLQPAGEIAGRVLHPDEKTAARGAIVVLRRERLRLGRLTDEEGRFRFDAVPLGTYALSITEPSTNAIANREVKVQENGQVIDMSAIVLDGEAPLIVSVQPKEDSVDIPGSEPIVLTFSEPIDPASVNARTFRVAVAGKGVAGRYEVSPDKPVVTFYPAAPLPDLTQVRVTATGHRLGFEGQVLEPGVRDLAGLGLASDLVFTYTTGDVTKPSVVSVHPADKASDVPLRSVFRVEFSEPVDPKSIRTFTLDRDGKKEEGRLNSQPIMGGRVIVFTPAAPLQPNAQYEVKIEGPVMDVAGNAMEAESLHFRFATLDTVAPVIRNLSMAPGITAVEGKSVPIVVEFEDDSDLAFVEYYLNRRLVQTAREAPFGSRIHLDPTLGREMIISAIGVDQAGNRSQPSLLPLEIAPNSPPAVRITSPLAGQASAGQLVALKVEATDDVGVAELGYTVNEGKVASGRKEISPATGAQLTFSFKIPMDYEIGSDIVLRAVAGDTGGQVAVSDTITLAVLGKLPPAVALVGVENNVSLDPGDDIRVSVQADDPTGVVEVNLSGTGALTFSELRTIDPPSSKPEERFVFKMPADASPTQTLTLTGRAVDTRGNAGSRSITLRINDRIAPVASLIQPKGKTKVEPGTEIPLMVKASDEIGVEKIDLLVNSELVQTREIASKQETTQHFKLFVSEDVELETDLHVKASVHDAAGNIGENTLILLAKDLRAPSVSIVSSAAENKILAGKTLRVKIKAEDRFGVAGIRYKVTGVVKAHGEFSIDPVGESAEREFDLKVPEAAAGGGTVSIIANATDRSGNARDTYWLNIRVLDVVPPKVVVVKPPDTATDVDPAIHVRLRFSEPISRRTVNAESMVLKGPDGVVPGSFYFDRWSRDANFKPAQTLERGERYTVTASAAITDRAGNPLQEVFTSHFTTDSTGPALAELIPENGADGVAALPVIRARFNEALKRETLTPEAISLVDASGEAIPTETKWRDRDRTLELRPKEALSLGSKYTIRITGLLTDIAGNSITDADGTPIDELTHRFTTGTIRFLSPQDGGTVLEKTRIPLEISPEGLAVASVVFEVNGQRSPAVPGPVFRMAYHVPAMVDAPHLTITAIAMDEKGKEIARKSLSTTVVPGLQNEPAILGVSKGGESYFRLFLSVPLETDLPVKLAVQEPSVARLPREPLVLRAGKKELRVPVEGVSKGNTFLTIQSERGNAALTISVSEPSPGTEQTVSSLPMGLCIQRAAFAQSLLIPKAGDYSLSIPLLATPARSEISVEVSARPGDILDVSDRATIASGSRLARVSLKAKAVGEAYLRLKSEDTVTHLRIVVGEPVQEAMQFLSGVASRPIGLSLKALPSPGPIHLPRTGTYTLTVPLLATPMTTKPRVEVSNRTPAIVEVEEDDVSIAEGSQAATLALKARGEGKGEILLTAGEQIYRLPIIIGDVETTLPPAAASQPVGMAVTPPAFSGQLIIPHLGKRRISVPLLPSVATEKTEVMLFSDDPDVMAVQPKAVIPDGSRMAQVSLHLKQTGSARLKMQVGNDVTWLPVTIGPTPETFVTGVGPKPLGLEVSPPGTGGRVFLNSGEETLIRLPLLSVPATEEVSVELRNRHPEISQATAASAVIPVGERALEITVKAKPGVTGTALTDLVFADRLKTLEVIVGQPSAGDKPIIVSPVVGFEVKK